MSDSCILAGAPISTWFASLKDALMQHNHFLSRRMENILNSLIWNKFYHYVHWIATGNCQPKIHKHYLQVSTKKELNPELRLLFAWSYACSPCNFSKFFSNFIANERAKKYIILQRHFSYYFPPTSTFNFTETAILFFILSAILSIFLKKHLKKWTCILDDSFQ